MPLDLEKLERLMGHHPDEWKATLVGPDWTIYTDDGTFACGLDEQDAKDICELHNSCAAMIARIRAGDRLADAIRGTNGIMDRQAIELAMRELDALTKGTP